MLFGALLVLLAVTSTNGLLTGRPNPERPTRIEALRNAVIRQSLDGQVNWKRNQVAENEKLKMAREALAQQYQVEWQQAKKELTQDQESNRRPAKETLAQGEKKLLAERTADYSATKKDRVESKTTDMNRAESKTMDTDGQRA
ncbi:uncharacterized protein LOC121871539 [Homarus americanus]|uniref:uncharacterized protein LOC121871539 n=1 Tax=Homarus americanus TaxID=6706 RepID=UPI001C47917C|nr:uncharacterized protein LOC121871539 [Homarus americanus]